MVLFYYLFINQDARHFPIVCVSGYKYRNKIITQDKKEVERWRKNAMKCEMKEVVKYLVENSLFLLMRFQLHYTAIYCRNSGIIKIISSNYLMVCGLCVIWGESEKMTIFDKNSNKIGRKCREICYFRIFIKFLVIFVIKSDRFLTLHIFST